MRDEDILTPISATLFVDCHIDQMKHSIPVALSKD